MASDEPTSSNIQHTALAEHNSCIVPGAVVVDADGTAVADEDAMPIVAIDYRRPVPFVCGGLVSWSSHSAPRDVHRV
jgi:hypothetical protein